MVNQANPPVILFIEDDPDDRLLFTFEVENSPELQSIIYLENSEEFSEYMNDLGKYARQVPDVVLINAFQFVRSQKDIQAELSSREEFRKIPVVLMADSTFEAEYFQLQSRSDIFGWFIKPVTREKLAALIRRIAKGIQLLLQVYLPLRVIHLLIEEFFKLA